VHGAAPQPEYEALESASELRQGADLVLRVHVPHYVSRVLGRRGIADVAGDDEDHVLQAGGPDDF
jgi:hypothetical protein